jgi:glycosyltransferase involved in cell wall biosynthesis
LFHPFNLALRIIDPPTPIIITDHGAYQGVKKRRAGLLKLGLALSITGLRRVICVSNHVKEELLSFYPVLFKHFPTLISPDNIIVIHNPIDTTKFSILDTERLKELKRKNWRKQENHVFSLLSQTLFEENAWISY